jgi:hypothetical protein
LYLNRGRCGSFRTRIVSGELGVFRFGCAGLSLVGALHLDLGLVLIYRSRSARKNLLASFLELSAYKNTTLFDGNLSSLRGSIVAENLFIYTRGGWKIRDRGRLVKVERKCVWLESR